MPSLRLSHHLGHKATALPLVSPRRLELGILGRMLQNRRSRVTANSGPPLSPVDYGVGVFAVKASLRASDFAFRLAARSVTGCSWAALAPPARASATAAVIRVGTEST